MNAKLRIPLFALSVVNFGLTYAGPAPLGPPSVGASCQYCNTASGKCDTPHDFYGGTTNCQNTPGSCTAGGIACT